MAILMDINEAALKYFGLKLLKQTSEYLEYSDGARVLLVNKEHFRYYSKNSTEPVPITPDIAKLAEILRKEFLGTIAEYKVFVSLNGKYEKKILKDVTSNEEH